MEIALKESQVNKINEAVSKSDLSKLNPVIVGYGFTIQGRTDREKLTNYLTRLEKNKTNIVNNPKFKSSD